MEQRNAMEERIETLRAQGKSAIGRYVFEIILIGLIVAMFLLSFGEIMVKHQSFWTFVGNTFVLFLFIVLTRATYYKKGVVRAKAQDAYLSACVAHAGLVEGMSGRQIESLQVFLNDRESKRLADLAERMLKEVGLSAEHTEAYAKMQPKARKEKYNRSQRRALKRVLTAKYKPLFAGMVLTDSTGKLAERERWVGDNAREVRYNVRRALSALITTGTFAYFAIDMLSAFSLSAFGWFLTRVVFVCVTALLSQLAGHNDVTAESIPIMQRKTAILKEFLGWAPPVEEKREEKRETAPAEEIPTAVELLKGEKTKTGK